MQLKLKILGEQGLSPTMPLEFLVDSRGGVIGRSPDNEFVLPDPEKYVSRKHGIFKFENGEFFFTDTSAAGTFFSNRDVLLHHDTLPLRGGDRLRIGNFELLVEIDQPTAAAGSWPSGMEEDLTAWPESNREPVGWPEEPAPWPPTEPPRGAADSAESPLSSLFDEPVSDKIPVSSSSFINQPDVDIVHSNYEPPEPLGNGGSAPPEPFSDWAPPEEEPPGPDSFNVLDLLGDAETPDTVPELPEPDWQLPEDFFGTALPKAKTPEVTPEPPAAVDAFPISDAEFPVPDNVEPEPVPESPSEMVPPERTALRPGPGTQPADGFSASRPPGQPAPVQSKWAEPAPVQPPPVQPLYVEPLPVQSEPDQGMEVQSASVQRAPASTAGSRDTELFRLFLDAAGMDDFPMPPPERLEALMKTLGLLFHDLVDGMITALRARAEEKRELRVEMTMIRAVNNNPLKSVPSARDAMAIMLAGPEKGFIGPVEAVREGFRDLMSHQMATTAALQASLAEQLTRFDPEAFERLFEEGIVFQKKSKCWDAYVKAYPNLVQESLENIFGNEFREVYERQMQVLRSAAESRRD